MVKKAMNLIFMGPPGVGKGTVAKVIAAKYNYIHLSTGEMFREEIASKSELGLKIAAIVEGGHYVPDEITNEIVKKKILSLLKENKRVILDGYPRTINQSEFLDSIKEFEYEVVELSAPEELIFNRLSGRRSCPKCKAGYHIIFIPSAKGEYCKKCDAKLIQRKDDTLENIKIRQEVYRTQTAPLIDYYQKKNKLHLFDASGEADNIAKDIAKKLIK